MSAMDRLLRAIDGEFGKCPSWQPLIDCAKEEWAGRGVSGMVRDYRGAIRLLEFHDRNAPFYPLRTWLEDGMQYALAQEKKRLSP